MGPNFRSRRGRISFPVRPRRRCPFYVLKRVTFRGSAGFFDAIPWLRCHNPGGNSRRRFEGSGRGDSACGGPRPTPPPPPPPKPLRMRSDPRGPRRRTAVTTTTTTIGPKTSRCTVCGRRDGIARTRPPLGAGRSGINTRPRGRTRRGGRLTANGWPTAGRFGWPTESWPAESSTQRPENPAGPPPSTGHSETALLARPPRYRLTRDGFFWRSWSIRFSSVLENTAFENASDSKRGRSNTGRGRFKGKINIIFVFFATDPSQTKTRKSACFERSVFFFFLHEPNRFLVNVDSQANT